MAAAAPLAAGSAKFFPRPAGALATRARSAAGATCRWARAGCPRSKLARSPQAVPVRSQRRAMVRPWYGQIRQAQRVAELIAPQYRRPFERPDALAWPAQARSRAMAAGRVGGAPAVGRRAFPPAGCA